MVSMQFVLQPLPGTDEQFIERIREVTDKVNRFGSGTHRIFEQLKIPVREVVIGPNHIGVLLEDGKAFRVAFSINSEKLDLTKSDNKCAPSGGVSATNAPKAPTSSRAMPRSRARLLRATGRTSSSGQGSGSRSTGVIIGGSTSNRPLVTVPATYVPEELISQAEVVLQGKSRNLIIRELQRTNLDVNLAVNNLLSRDDEEAEDTEEGGDNYVPEDLISLLDNGFSGDNNSVIIDPSDGLFSEEIFSNYSSIRNLLFDRIRSERSNAGSTADSNQSNRASTSSSGVIAGSGSLSAQISSANADREAFSRWRDRQYYGPRRWISKDDYTWDKDTDSKKKEPSTMPSPIWISEELQPWPDKVSTRFKTIGALYSEFIALSENGELHQWRWSDLEPFKSDTDNVYHPKTLALNIAEKVELISANFIRCSIVTESNRVATWMDEQLGYLGVKLEHTATAFNEFNIDPIATIHVCSLYTAVRTDNNNIYWWGVLPFDQRRYLWDKFRTKTKKPFKMVVADINVGSQVIMKKCPIFQTGSIGFTCTNGVPKVGQLLNSVWDFSDVCRMKILNIGTSSVSDKCQATGTISNTLTNITDKDISKTTPVQATSSTKSGQISSTSKESTDRIDMPPPPSPASSTCSDTGSVTSHKRTKRMTTKDDSNNCQEGRKDEELWQLKDVVFVEDKVGPIGKVLKVDGDYVAVRFPPLSCVSGVTGLGTKDEGKEDDWQQCRLLRREDVQVFRTAVSSRGPDWLQKQPKKINIGADPANANAQLLTIAVDTRGIHVIKKVFGKIHYSLYNLYNSKQEQNCQFPTDCASFIGASSNNITMACNNDCSGNSSTIVLRDGNGALYPLAKDCIGSIKDPQWFDLPPVKSVTMATISLPPAASCINLKSKVCMTALLFETQKLMPHILRCDVKNCIALLMRLEKEDRKDTVSVVEERCDGNRNIFHACVIMCAPTSNKDSQHSPELSSSTAEKKPVASGVSLPRTGPGLSYGGSAFAGNGSSFSENSSFSTVTAGVSSSSSTSATLTRENRISLRDMMHRLINTEQSTEQNSQPPTTSAGEDHAYMPLPWSLESGAAASNLSASGAQNADITDEDVSKVLPSSSQNIGVSNSKMGTPNYTFDLTQRREHAILILQHMCASAAMRPYLFQMLSAKDAQGQTAFMLAVSCRAYEAGIILLSTILSVSDQDTHLKEAMIFPSGSPADQSPLHVICFNDTCSFTWTGADHINQNIFECKTCGLTGSLCCCTECARVCHKGHDCKLKRTAPTAYCDCWEKCKCKALIAGNLTKRFALLCKLVSSTDLVTKFNSKGESILLFLIQTVGRQIVEQRQYRFSVRVRNVSNNTGSANGSNTVITNRKPSSLDIDSDMPDHDLEPPKFARKALERLLIDWQAVRSMIMSGAERNEANANVHGNPGDGGNSESFNVFMQSQHGSTLIDKFTHSLIVKCTSDHLDTLLLTLVRELQNFLVVDRCKEAEEVARRFVRSVARVFVIFNLEKQPNPDKRKSHTSCNKYVQSCVKVFQTLHKISIEELCEVSEALIAPVRLGVVRPTAPFTMSSSNLDNSDDLFSVEPLTPSNVESAAEQIVVHDAINVQSTSFNVQQNYDVVAMDTLRDPSESEEIPNRESNLSSHDEDMIESQRNEEGMQDDESDNDFTFNDAETESDSDDNQSNQDAQRNVQTGATVGSETDIGVLFLEDESGDSSAQEEDGSEDGESDDQSDEFSFNDQQLERRNINPNSRNDLTPQTMQWAIRSRDNARSSVRVPTGSNLVFIDPMALRRSAVPANTAVNTTSAESHTMATTASNLGRAFGITIRQISELLAIMSYNVTNDIETSLKIPIEEAVAVQAFVEKRLKPTWDWMFTVMDGTEAQLKFGAYLTNYTDPNHPLHPLNLSAQATTSQTSTSTSSSVGVNVIGSSSRRDFFTYCLSLMRAHTSEHRDALPVLDITALRHMAYVLDAFVYYMRNDSSFYDRNDSIAGRVNNLSNCIENDDTDDELSNIEESNIDRQYSANSSPNVNMRKYTFFARSDSTLSLGCSAPEGFDLPLDMAMPLADKPHLLQPNSKRQDLFANLPLHVVPTVKNNTAKRKMSHQGSIDQPPTRLGFSNFMKIENEIGVSQHMPEQEINADALEAKEDSSTYKDEDAADSNIYVQLKKKQCLDDSKLHKGVEGNHYIEDHADAVDVQMIDDTPGTSRKSDTLITTRPEVIIAPNKSILRIGTRDDLTTLENSLSESLQSSLSAVRSVIVRAGASSFKLESNDSSLPECKNASASTSHASHHTCDYSREKTSSQSVVFPVRGSLFYKSSSSELPSWNFLLSRWKLALDLFGRVFMDDVGMEHGSVLPELRGFPVKEMRFRRHMEKLRNGQQRDLVLCKLERNRESLIIQTFKELNAQFGTQNRRAQPPITFNRVKVTFKDEPGEGSGVARSFYTSISEALLASAKMPNLDSVQAGGTHSKYGVPFSSILRSRTVSGSSRDPPTLQRRGTGSKILWRTARERKALNADARPYTPTTNADISATETSNDHLSVHLQQLGERLYPKIHSINSSHASKITGMLLEIPTPQLLSVLSSDETLRQKVNEAVEIINFKQKSEINVQNQQKKLPSAALAEPIDDDNEPLFYSPGKRGFYTPRQGLASFERINAFRNIGRLIGLCLLQNELLPLFLQRHVLKYMLGRKIKFHDLAFFDPALYESFRQIIQNAQTKEGEEIINRMELSFVIDLMKEEGCGNRELIPGGRDVPVTSANIFEYIRRYTEYRLIKSQEKALEALKDGIFDVLPDNCMNSLTAEDLRLLLNGVGDINVSTLISYTTFNDESSEGPDKLLKFKRWFWSIVEKMNTLERQDLVYFWTGSPALPASEEGFQPLPSVTIRPADDSHLPTANTCISRLYIPLYSSKSILRSKMLMAIKSKNFGFV
ncbi:E3 ubiquitin-protein ligase hyd [Drosophila grimshawi]|uniref:HECT-type E3 ubiquitin transferase n=1 Tax=Drosophila grimshawi TaxID=7222 RepID=B4JYU3_DROGR|nr:E3 ubiquitin-protein ligase hyd [Drosophila grimshawi]EDV98558.1 GH22338 [Drosophila grimshawi]